MKQLAITFTVLFILGLLAQEVHSWGWHPLERRMVERLRRAHQARIERVATLIVHQVEGLEGTGPRQSGREAMASADAETKSWIRDVRFQPAGALDKDDALSKVPDAWLKADALKGDQVVNRI